MKVVISVVSHNHFGIIKSLGGLPPLAQEFEVCLIDNVGEHGLQQWCKSNKIDYVLNDKPLGFGENNNKIFNHVYSGYIEENCWFLILNPDVIVQVEDIYKLLENMKADHSRLATINLFKDQSYSVYDNAVRNFPTLADFMKSYLLGKNPSILDKSEIKEPRKVDWASGSFLMFDANLYKSISGFDSRYFMYCEDIDICLRSSVMQKENVTYYPSIKALHFAAHSNRKLLSKSFIWHLKSIVRYLRVKNTLGRRTV